MIKFIILVNKLDSEEFFYNNKHYVYLNLIKYNYYTKKKNISINKNKLINIEVFINLFLLIINSAICSFILTNKNTNIFTYNKYTGSCVTIQCTNYKSNDNFKRLVQKFKIFIKFRFEQDKKYNRFCSLTLRDSSNLINKLNPDDIELMPTTEDLEQGRIETLNSHYEYLNALLEKAFDPVKKKILKNHILKTSKFLENLPLIENPSFYPFYFELADKFNSRRLPVRNKLCLKTNIFSFDSSFKSSIKRKNIANSGLSFKFNNAFFYRSFILPTYINPFKSKISEKYLIFHCYKIKYKNLFYKSKLYRPGMLNKRYNNKLEYLNKILGLKHQIGKYNFKYKFIVDAVRKKNLSLMDKNIKFNKLFYISNPKVSNYGFLLNNGLINTNFTVECSTRLNTFLEGKLLYCLNSNKLWIKLTLI